jgi:hypothetical protein
VSCLHALSFSKYNVIVKCKDPTGWWLKGPFAEASLGAVLVVASLSGSPGAAQTATVSVVPDADSFVRSLAPTGNYGGAGAISVSGSAAVNGSGQQNGLFDSLPRFLASPVVLLLESNASVVNRSKRSQGWRTGVFTRDTVTTCGKWENF